MKSSHIDKIKAFLPYASDIVGVLSTETIAFMTGDLQGAILGGTYGVIVARSISEMADRVLSNREKVRVSSVAYYALKNIENRQKHGESIRDDGFFDEKTGKRSDAEEIFEGVLLKAKNEHEEKKTRILGNIFANTAFTMSFSAGEANYLLKIIDNLTYRDLCILALVKRKDDIPGIELRKEWMGEVNPSDASNSVILDFSTKKTSIFQQTYELVHKGLLICSASKEEISALVNAFDIIPSELELTIMGLNYCQIMGLDDISEEDIREIEEYFR